MQPKHILMASVLAGLLAVVLVRVQLHSERGNPVILLKATETVAPGQALGTRVEEVTLPGDELFPNLLQEAPTSDLRDYVTTTALRETVHAGQVILYRHLESAADPGLRSQIPRGAKAISIEVDAAGAVAYLVEPGDRVDVLGTLPESIADPSAAQRSSQRANQIRNRFSRDTGLDADLLGDLVGPGIATRLVTRRLLEDVEVLAVGRRYRRAEPSEVGSRYDTVTLLVDDDQARTVAEARDAHDSPMTLVLRGTGESPADGGPGGRSSGTTETRDPS